MFYSTFGLLCPAVFHCGRISPVSLSSIEFLLFFSQAWCGYMGKVRMAEEKDHKEDRKAYWALCVLVFCQNQICMSHFKANFSKVDGHPTLMMTGSYELLR